jgi:hypothetical protein
MLHFILFLNLDLLVQIEVATDLIIRQQYFKVKNLITE